MQKIRYSAKGETMSFEVTEEIYRVANTPGKKVRILKIVKVPSNKIVGIRRTFFEEEPK